MTIKIASEAMEFLCITFLLFDLTYRKARQASDFVATRIALQHTIRS
jgi:hypothetical protein